MSQTALSKDLAKICFSLFTAREPQPYLSFTIFLCSPPASRRLWTYRHGRTSPGLVFWYGSTSPGLAQEVLPGPKWDALGKARFDHR